MTPGTRRLPWYYAVNDRPVKIVELPHGGMQTLVLDWASGGLVPDEDYFEQVFTPGKDVDQFDKDEFDRKVQLLRLPIVDNLFATPIAWTHTGDGEVPYRATVGQATLTVRVNDFPAEPLYTLLVEGEEIVDMDDWPASWVKPSAPQALFEKLPLRGPKK